MPSGNEELTLQPSSTYVAPVPYRGHNIFLGLRALDHFRNNYLNPMVTSRLNTVTVGNGSLAETANNMEYYRRTRSPKRMLKVDNNTYEGGNLGGITVTKKRKKPYWVSPRGAGNMTVMPGDPEMVFFAPIAAGAGIAASPAISSMVGSAMSGINTAGDALAATAAGQRLTSGLNFLGNAVKSSKAWPWIDAGLTSAFSAYGIDKVRRGDIHNVGDAVETGLDLLPLSQLARPVVNTAGRTGNFFKNISNNYLLKRSNNFTNTDDVSIANDEYLNSFLNGSKPMILTVYKGPGFESELNTHNILLEHKYVDLERPFGNGTQTLRYYINEPKLKLTIATYKDLYKSRLNLNTNNVDDIYNYLINNPKLLDPNVNFGTTGLLDIIGVNLGYGPKDAILFGLGEFGSPGTIVSRNVLNRMKFYGYDKSVPGIYNILRKNIERGTLGIKPTSVNGSHVGFGYIPPQEFPRGLISREPLIARGAPKITAENAASITPAQWTAAQDAAIARGDMAEAQRLRDLHAKVKGYNSSLPLYHGSPEKNITVFNPDAKAGTWEGSGGTVFFTPSFEAADTYAKGKGILEMTHDPGKVYKVYSAHKNPKVVDYDGASYLGTGTKLSIDPGDGILRSILNPKGGKHFLDNYTVYNYDKLPIENLEYPRYYAVPRNKHVIWDTERVAGRTSEEASKAMSEGYDVAILKNVDEGVGPNTAKIGPIDDYAIRDTRLIKSADAVTYDNNGVRIPLGERDNFKLNDIRYSWLAPFIGLGTLGISSRKQGGKLIPKGLKGLVFPNMNEFTPELIKEINDKALESITSHPTYKDSSRPLSGTDPIMAALASYYTGTKGISALYEWLLSRYTQGLANTYKKLRENNQDIQPYTGNNKRHENILFADKEARRLGPTYNNQGPLGFLYDTLLDPAIRGYTKILDKYPLLNIILP